MSVSALHQSLFMNVERTDPTHHPLKKRLDVPQGQSGCFAEEVNVLPVPRFERPIGQPVAHPPQNRRHRCCAVTAISARCAMSGFAQSRVKKIFAST
jgi:hypothetical protein